MCSMPFNLSGKNEMTIKTSNKYFLVLYPPNFQESQSWRLRGPGYKRSRNRGESIYFALISQEMHLAEVI